MRTQRIIDGDQVFFVLSDLDPAYHDAARGLVYGEHPAGFAKSFPADSPHLDRIYDNFARYAEAMVLQAARAQPIPWQEALTRLLALVADEPITWQLGGSGALAVRGMPVTPGDLDLVTDDAGARRLADLLLPYLVEPLVDSTGWICQWFCRAWLGMRVEWIGEPDASADEPEPFDFGPTAVARAEVVTWRGHAVRVPPLDLQRRTCEVRGLIERAAMIQQWMEGQL